MNKLFSFLSSCTLLLFLLVGGNAALAADTDGDGVADSKPIQISAGQSHACALDASGVHCWGYNGNGQLVVPSLVNPIAVSASSGNHTCALDDMGVHCWGDNGYDQTTVPPLVNPVAVSTGRYHTCALDDVGVHCWGLHINGQTTVPVLANPVAVSAGLFHTCAIDDAGLHCWGDNTEGQATVPALVNPVVVSAGGYHTCAIDDMGMHCWGDNTYGQTIVPALVNPVAMSAGGGHTCALDDEGVHCWGYNDDYGQTTVPILVNPLVISVGSGYTCAVDDSGVHCWGNGNNGQITVPALSSQDNCATIANTNQLDTDSDGQGDACDTDDDNDSTLDVSDNCLLTANADQLDADGDGQGNVCDTDDDNDGVLDKPLISVGGFHTCALDNTGVKCWGDNDYGQTTVPILVNPVVVSAGGAHTCALDDTGVKCWGDNSNGQTMVPTLVNPVALDAGYAHTCALDSAGLHCWGYNNNGQATVPALVNPITVDAGMEHTCAIDDTGVHCWGNNGFGRATVPALVSPVAVSAGEYHSCAIDDSGVRCWGWNYYGQAAVPALVNPVAVSAGYEYTCALDSTGMHCWGLSNWGQATVPVLVNPVVMSTGVDHTCAIDDMGVHCWGRNIENQTTVPSGISGDNCPFAVNIDQLDADGDLSGDVCDTDDDNDGVLDVNDVFPFDDTESVDTDGDNLGDNSDPLVNDPDMLNALNGTVTKDKSGSSVAFAGDFDGDGYGDYVIGTPGYDIPPAAPAKLIKDAGRAQVISGRNGDVLISITGDVTKDAMGFAVAGGGDINNDGFDDVLVGAPLADHLPLKDTGSVTVLFGGGALPDQTLYGATAKTLFGSALALGDVNNDGKADIIIGAPKADDLRDLAHKLVDAGSVTVLSGEDYSELNMFYGAIAKAYAGTSVAAGKFDAVPGVDIIIGAPKDDDVDHKLADAGSVTVYNTAGTRLLKQYGAVAKATLGKSVAAGNVDNIAGDEVLAGAPGDDNGAVKDTGSVTVFFAGATPPVTKYGAVAKSGLGNAVAAADVNGDGFADIIAGEKLDDKPGEKITKDTGSVSVWSGNGYAQIGSTLYGVASKDYFGSAVSAGDINSDGKADLIIGIPGKDIPPSPPAKTIKDAGAVQVLSGALLF